MNKSDLVMQVAEQTALPRNTAEVAVNTIFKALQSALTEGDVIAIAGFGTFSVKSREERKGRNPRTGEEITIAASKAPGFKAAKALKDALNT
jgi:DNA-binding protein HU-beta